MLDTRRGPTDQIDEVVLLRVLVVDDGPRNIFALTARLERAGLEVLSTESGR